MPMWQPGLGDDPGLSAAGAIRAEELSRVLGDVDVVQGLDAILVAPEPRVPGDGRAAGAAPEPAGAGGGHRRALTRVAKRHPQGLQGRDRAGGCRARRDSRRSSREFQGSKKVPATGGRRVRQSLHRQHSLVRQGEDAAPSLRRAVRARAPGVASRPASKRIGRQVAVGRQRRVGQAPGPAARRDVRVTPLEQRPRELLRR